MKKLTSTLEDAFLTPCRPPVRRGALMTARNLTRFANGIKGNPWRLVNWIVVRFLTLSLPCLLAGQLKAQPYEYSLSPNQQAFGLIEDGSEALVTYTFQNKGTDPIYIWAYTDPVPIDYYEDPDDEADLIGEDSPIVFGATYLDVGPGQSAQIAQFLYQTDNPGPEIPVDSGLVVYEPPELWMTTTDNLFGPDVPDDPNDASYSFAIEVFDVGLVPPDTSDSDLDKRALDDAQNLGYYVPETSSTLGLLGLGTLGLLACDWRRRRAKA